MFDLYFLSSSDTIKYEDQAVLSNLINNTNYNERKRYGKSYVKLLHVTRNKNIHTVKEYEVNMFLTLETEDDYTVGNNKHVVATDSQKNTVYLLAKQFGIESPEKFALLLVKHFLTKYAGNVIEATAEVEEAFKWKRMRGDHCHAFSADSSLTRTCKVTQKSGEVPQIFVGLKNFRILKSTQSSFVKFVDDEYRTLPCMEDRVFSTVVETEWKYFPSVDMSGKDYDSKFEEIIEHIIDWFAGDSKIGIHSPSVQMTMYQCLTSILSKSVGGAESNYDVFLPVDKPSGIIEATTRCS
ncbi:uaZ [Lepeophtheirus salmonis]|uniref:Uricase n=1 Tax=Lepeophtheirus salmonis TaxID=72036 RepID=A0A7R8D0D7_LEPSM|nr:uaZ [Lepeophtheirus salmonis]CAF2983111.1 uaZ [Lepeophtheirus salmonis]